MGTISLSGDQASDEFGPLSLNIWADREGSYDLGADPALPTI